MCLHSKPDFVLKRCADPRCLSSWCWKECVNKHVIHICSVSCLGRQNRPQQHVTLRARDSDLGGCPASTRPCQEPACHTPSSLTVTLTSQPVRTCSSSASSTSWILFLSNCSTPHIHSHLLHTVLQTALCMEPFPGTHCPWTPPTLSTKPFVICLSLLQSHFLTFVYLLLIEYLLCSGHCSGPGIGW